MPNLFNKKILNNRIKDYSVDNIEQKIAKIKNWQRNLSTIKGLNEIRLQSKFLEVIFENILGYENTPQKEEWTFDIEATTDVDSKRPDGILGFFERVENKEIRGHEAVIELKGPQISLDKDQKRKGTTYKSPVDQAFSYTNKLDKCKWVIVSNFMEIRLYKVGRSKEYYEVFRLDDLGKTENFKKFYYLLNKNNLLSETGKSVTYKLSEKTVKKEEDISVKFYNLYKNVRINLFEHLKENNPDKESELLLENSQKFLDRIIFISFCEDKGLLPNDLLHEAIQKGKDSFSPSDTAVWDQIRGVFRSIDEGNAAHNINAYNGGLFKYDKDLDNLVIENKFFEAIYDISDYDFDSDVDVNILGHIFEQSISDIEKLKSDIKDDEFDENESKRKKDGIFYTPQYITSYIVENAIGGYLEDLKEDLGYYELPDIENAGSNSWETRYTKQHLNFYNKYEEKLKNIKVLDPACGSGAFLNQAFDYLLDEHNWLNKQRDLLKGGQSSIFALDSVQRDILKNNIFGVDLNEESVEITKLSLWLKTANKRKALTNLDDNIKCGNSLIDDPEIAGNKAFNWEDEFKDIMELGGFDIVLGNPPYVDSENMSRNMKNQRKYLSDHYVTTAGNWDLYIPFVEKSIKLIKNNGFTSMITPNKWLSMQYGEKLREFIKDNLYQITDFSCIKVFEDAGIFPIIFQASKKINKKLKVELFYENNGLKSDIKYLEKSSKVLEKFNNFSILLSSNIELIEKIMNQDNIICDISKVSGAFTTSEAYELKEFLKDKKVTDKKEKYYKFVNTGTIDKFLPLWGTQDTRYIKDDYKYPVIEKELFKNKFENRFKKFNQSKIIITGIRYFESFYDEKNEYLAGKSTIVLTDLKQNYNYESLVSILNSKLIIFYIKEIYKNSGMDGGINFSPDMIRRLPIPKIEKKYSLKLKFNSDKLHNNKLNLIDLEKMKFNYFLKKYTSNSGIGIKGIINESNFYNDIYSGRARKIRNFTVNINTNIITIYLDKSSSGKYEVLKFEENDRYKRKYLKYYFENLTDQQLAEIDEKSSGNILKKTLKAEIPDYNKDHVVKKVVKEWESLQQEIRDLKIEIEKADNEIDQIVYNLYNLTEEEIQIIKNS